MSAYEVWLSVGNTGSAEDFLDSLVGKDGANGYAGSDGFSGNDGVSAYQQWLNAGNIGTSEEFLQSLIGQTGLSGIAGAAGIGAYQLWLSLGHQGTEADFLNWLVGDRGLPGPSGSPGPSGATGPSGAAGPSGSPGPSGDTGQSAYQLWLLQPGNAGKSETEFLASLIGLQGPQGVCTVGDTGATGPSGAPGPTGAPGSSAFEVWLQSNPGGTIAQFWEYLRGPTGPTGLTGSTGPQGPQGIQGSPGTSGISSTSRGAFQSFLTQVVPAPNTATKMYFEVSDISNHGVTMNGNAACSTASCTEITIANAGTYNIQFSAQLFNDQGGGSGSDASIWLGKSGSPITYSASNVSVPTNNPYAVAAWNFFVVADAGDTFELYWAADNTSLQILGSPPVAPRPGIPSIILTVNQVG